MINENRQMTNAGAFSVCHNSVKAARGVETVIKKR